MKDTFNTLEMEAALCVWEAINDWTLNDSPRDDWKALREHTGSVELRHWSIELGQWCLKVYDICTKHDSDFFDGIAYDWEVIPMILGYVDINDSQVTAGIKLQAPEQVALMVARRHLFTEFRRICCYEADQQWGYDGLIDDHEERVEQSFTLGEEPKEFVKWLGEKYDLTAA